MEEQKFSFLFNRYFDDQATSKELDEFFLLAKSDKHRGDLEQLMTQRWNTFEAKKNPFDQMAKQRILSAIYSLEKPGRAVYVKHIWPKIAIAAAIATVLVSLSMWFFKGSSNQTNNQIIYANDVAPGKQGATLTLASGKKIRLTETGNGELAREAGVIISKSSTGQLTYEIKDVNTEANNINTLSTAKGETYQVRLPDGSLVWLNAASSLTYATKLNDGNIRRVKLDGEGYFEIAKDKAHPFIVESRGQQVAVLGTHFNINSYADESSIKTTLLEGMVRVNDRVVLKPNQQSILTGSDQITVKQADVTAAIDWKNGDFIFKRESLEQIMRKVARWYNVEINYDPAVDVNQTFSGLVSRSKNISQILISMESTGRLKFKIENRRVFVSK